MTKEEQIEKIARALANRRNAEFPNAEMVASHFHYIEDAKAALSCMPDMSEAVELVRKVCDYYEGNKPYDFHKTCVTSMDRSNASFDSWRELHTELQKFLEKHGGK